MQIFNVADEAQDGVDYMTAMTANIYRQFFDGFFDAFTFHILQPRESRDAVNAAQKFCFPSIYQK